MDELCHATCVTAAICISRSLSSPYTCIEHHSRSGGEDIYRAEAGGSLVGGEKEKREKIERLKTESSRIVFPHATLISKIEWTERRGEHKSYF
jgi:hypothetical protein